MGVKEASARYPVTGGVARAGQDVPAGFKRSEVGLIPEDWLALPFDQLFRRLNGKNYQVLATDYQPYGQLPVIDQGLDMVAGWTDRLEKRFDCPTGGVVVFGDHTRVVKYVSADFAVGADGTKLLVGRDPESTRFLAYQMQATEIPSAGYSRHFKFLADSFFALPPSACERVEVAEALSDADALIESLQQLIAKKRALKQGVMQALLTGLQRLPGFSQDWKVRKLGDFGDVYGGLSGKTGRDFGHGHGRFVTFMGVMSSVVVDMTKVESVDVLTSESQNAVSKHDLLFNGSSETPQEIGLCAVVNEQVGDVYLNSFCFGYRMQPGAPLDPLFLAYFYRSNAGRELLAPLAQGAIRYNLSKRALLELEFKLPSREEQAAIASVLSDMDADIDVLETRLAKTRDLKAGMMQALLTGRIRLPLDTAA